MRKINDQTEVDLEALQRWNAAVDLLEDGDLSSAISIFIKLHEENYEGAAYAVGWLLTEAAGNFSDVEQAKFWYQKAIDYEGDVNAMFAVARLYLKEGGRDNIESAVAYLRMAAQHNNLFALILLGEVFETTALGASDHTQAKQYYKQAVKLGAVYPMLSLGRLAREEGQYHLWIWWKVLGAWNAFKIALMDPCDIRLWRVSGQDQLPEPKAVRWGNM